MNKMEFNILNYILVMFLAGIGSFGGGLAGTNIMRDLVINWNWMLDEFEMMRIMSLSQFNGYSQGMMIAGYLAQRGQRVNITGDTAEILQVGLGLGAFGVILGITAFLLPSLLIIIIILKIGEKLYKNNTFNYSVKYINLLAAGMICVMFYQYVAAVFAIDMIFFIMAAGIACFLNLVLNVKPTYIVLGGVLLGVIWEIIPALRSG